MCCNYVLDPQNRKIPSIKKLISKWYTILSSMMKYIAILFGMLKMWIIPLSNAFISHIPPACKSLNSHFSHEIRCSIKLLCPRSSYTVPNITSQCLQCPPYVISSHKHCIISHHYRSEYGMISYFWEWDHIYLIFIIAHFALFNDLSLLLIC